MSMLWGGLSLLALLAAAGLFARLLRPRGVVEGGLAFALVLSVLIVLPGYLLSALTRLADLRGWALADGGLLLVAVALTARLRGWRGGWGTATLRAIERRMRGADRRSFCVRLLWLLGATLALTALVNFAEILLLEPGTPDVHQYHLARVAYYLQQGSLRYFPATFWAQVLHPKVATLLLCYTYLASGSLAPLTQLVQFLAYFACLLTGYGLCRLLGYGRQVSLVAALCFALLTICLVEAATAQNDLLLAAYAGIACYFLLAYRQWGGGTSLVLAAVAVALGAGVKATFFLVLPSLLCIALPLLRARRFPTPPLSAKHALLLTAALLLAIAIITVPSGYGENFRRFGHPFGPKALRAELSTEGGSPRVLATNGLRNLARCVVDFLTLDGYYPLPGAPAVQGALTGVARGACTALGLRLDSPPGVRPGFPFSYHKSLIADETLSGWGVLGFLLLWPAVWLVALGGVRAPLVRPFAWAAVLHPLVLSLLVPYDPFHGRFFIVTALVALPAVAACLAAWRGRLARAYLGTVAVLGCLGALTAVTFRLGTPLLTYSYAGVTYPSAFTLTREQQLMRECPKTRLAFILEEVLPERAVVAVDTQHALPEYCFFGDRFTRRIIPLRPFTGPRHPLPPEAQYLIYDATSPYATPGGILLTAEDYPLGVTYIRKLWHGHPGRVSHELPAHAPSPRLLVGARQAK